jgi:hypothetical protein
VLRWRDTDLINRKDVKEVVRMFEKDVFPILGSLFVEDVREGHITQVTDILKQRGVNHLAPNILTDVPHSRIKSVLFWHENKSLRVIHRLLNGQRWWLCNRDGIIRHDGKRGQP